MAAEKTRYSDKELIEFKELIIKKLEDARKELVNLQAALNSANEHGTDDTANTFKVLEDGSTLLLKRKPDNLLPDKRSLLNNSKMH
jgi:DnaK suppressor protein